MRRILGMHLSDLNAEVFEAENGKHALEVLHSMDPAPELVLVDWNMPEMNGIDFVRAVRSDPNYRNLTLMMVTTETEMGQMAAALAAGANEYVMKPFTKDALIDKITLLGLAD